MLPGLGLRRRSRWMIGAAARGAADERTAGRSSATGTSVACQAQSQRTGDDVAVRGVAVLLAALMLCSACSGSEQPELVSVAESWRVAEPPDPSSTRLVINVLGGQCWVEEEELGAVEVRESVERVVISAYIREPATPRGQGCTDVGRDHRAEVVLREPLGGRELVDPACTAEVMKHYDCRPTAVLD